MRFSVVILSQTTPVGLINDLLDQTFQDFEVLTADEDGIVNAMNSALNRAAGEIFVRIDGDVRLPKEWLEELNKTFLYTFASGVTGPTFVPSLVRENRDSIKAMERPNWFLRWLFDYNHHAPAKICNCGSVSYGSNFFEHIEAGHLTGYSLYRSYEIDHLEGTNWAMKTDLIRRVGGFDPKFDGVAEWFDSDVVYKIKKRGYCLRYNPKAVVWHMLEKTSHYQDRFAGLGRIKNWLRFHWRHSTFHYKKVIWFCMMIGYFLTRRRK